MTFGLLSPGKGIENVISAMPAIVARHPDALYYIVGATHPNLLKSEGEAYRYSLQQLAAQAQVADNIRWVDDFLAKDALLDMIEAADVYVTPYLGAGQATSGTLSYAVALGKAVVSTPYLHARELLADRHGILVPFNDAAAIAEAVSRLFDDTAQMHAMQSRAYERGRSMTWSGFADRSLDMIASARNPERANDTERHVRNRPPPNFEAVVRLSDDTGILQHSVLGVPDRRHGYCIDDAARALMLVNRVSGFDRLAAARLAHRYAAFIQHAWNDDANGFRNFMGYNRAWLESCGSEDSNGRALWALAQTVADSQDVMLTQWASKLFDQTANIALDFNSPRAIAFAALGSVAVISRHPDHAIAHRIASRGGTALLALFAAHCRADWTWFETVVAYDNCRLPEALLRVGAMCDDAAMIQCGLDALAWIMQRQTSPSGLFRPVGSDGFGRERTLLPFDQQPVEAWAAIDGCAAAYAASGDSQWIAHAKLAHDWFFGANDRAAIVGDTQTGRCYDGINPRGVNINSGAESVLAFHLADQAFRALAAQLRPAGLPNTVALPITRA